MSSACSATAASAGYKGSCWNGWQGANALFTESAFDSTPSCRVRRARVKTLCVEARLQTHAQAASHFLLPLRLERGQGRGEVSIWSPPVSPHARLLGSPRHSRRPPPRSPQKIRPSL